MRQSEESVDRSLSSRSRGFEELYRPVTGESGGAASQTNRNGGGGGSVKKRLALLKIRKGVSKGSGGGSLVD